MFFLVVWLNFELFSTISKNAPGYTDHSSHFLYYKNLCSSNFLVLFSRFSWRLDQKEEKKKKNIKYIEVSKI